MSHAFPDFLTPAFTRSMLERVAASVAVLDAQGEILWVNPAWNEFAGANGLAFSIGDYPSYLARVRGPLRAFYEEVFAEALGSGEVFEQDYECSSPEVIRHYRMRVLPFPSRGLVVEHTPIAVGKVTASSESAVEERFLSREGTIVQCSNCRRVRHADAGDTERWAWVPEWVAHCHPRTSHGLCTPCLGFYWKHRPKR